MAVGSGRLDHLVNSCLMNYLTGKHILLGVTLPLAALITLLFFNIDRASHEQSIRELGYAEDA